MFYPRIMKTENEYHVGQVVYEKKHGERNKLKTSYKKQVVIENWPRKIINNDRNRIIHNDNIKSESKIQNISPFFSFLSQKMFCQVLILHLILFKKIKYFEIIDYTSHEYLLFLVTNLSFYNIIKIK